MFKIDLHVHSKYSGDSASEPEEIVERAIELGLDGIVFTEHYSFEASEPVEALREKFNGHILVFRGVEFSTREGHCLVFGVNTDRLIGKYPDVSELIEVVTREGGVIIPAHPFRGNNSLGDSIRHNKGFTAIEGFNGYNHHSYNMMAVELAKELGMPFTGGSDAHEPFEVGQCYTEFYRPVNEHNLVELLKSGCYRGVDIRKISRWRF
ncbi:MAG: PHP domain-containing protein [Nitrospirae bacterium]|nr:PHP domain-containing protein [Nitrospirota bacterium]